MHTWINKLSPMLNKHADQTEIMPPSTPMSEQSQAPNYTRAINPNQSCDSCAFNEPSSNYCQRYNFNNQPDYTCDSWQTADLNLSEKLANQNPLKLPPIQAIGAPNTTGLKTPLNPALQRPLQGAQRPPTQLPPANWQPSAVAPIAAQNGDLSTALSKTIFPPVHPSTPGPSKIATQLGEMSAKSTLPLQKKPIPKPLKPKQQPDIARKVEIELSKDSCQKNKKNKKQKKNSS